jgi:ABC-type polysaccharide/polyol phosphate export permease
MRQTGRFLLDTANATRLWRVWTHLAITDLRSRYARSLLGFGWILATFAIWAGGVGLVYARLFALEVRTFVPFLSIGFAIWGFLTASLVESAGAFIGAAGYVKQFNLPKQVYVYRAFCSQLVSLGLSLVVVAVVLAVFGKLTLAAIVSALPGIGLLCSAALLHAFLSAYLTPYLRDFPHVIGSAMSVLFFLTPIIFPPEMLAKRGLASVYHFNPFYYLIEAVRHPLLTGELPGADVFMGALLYVILLAALVFGVCKALDRRLVYAL